MTYLHDTSLHDGRDCRSIQDALVRLPAIQQHDVARIWATLIRRPDDEVCGIVLVGVHSGSGRHYVQLPNFTRFQALTTDGSSIHSEIAVLNGGVVDKVGVVVLASGQSIRAVRFKPGLPLMYEFTEQDRAIVHCALKLLGRLESCRRTLDEDLLPNWHGLDYSVVARMDMRHLERLEDRIAIEIPGIAKAKIRRALKRAGLRRLRSPRRTPGANILP